MLKSTIGPWKLPIYQSCIYLLIELTKELSVDGAETVKSMYGADGWIAHHNADIWRSTSPVGGSG
ncbi:hypothetical protein GCM10007383_28290 [Arenibacter certesii]|uniref:Glycosyl hydrolase family 95 catalytic domain-containing protein n=1 Tax=Arenibacter certesii TaxID=228955 RepID=A0A918J317_9FLAO|nr:hypothetical protein [Arenibacter certesii]GGW41980.1 hypothetical protein GCM10007383_28290 [Arenibacter certesii]